MDDNEFEHFVRPGLWGASADRPAIGAIDGERLDRGLRHGISATAVVLGVLVIGAIFALVSGCSATTDRWGTPVAPPSPRPDLQGNWRAESIRGGGVETEPGVTSGLRFETGQAVEGTDPCGNHLVGSYQIEGSELTFSGWTATWIACDALAAFRRALDETAGYRNETDRLVLLDRFGAATITFARDESWAPGEVSPRPQSTPIKTRPVGPASPTRLR